jgi:hypothetical protein
VRSFKIRVVVCDRCLGMLGERLLKIRGLCAIAKRSVGIAVWGCGVRFFKVRVVCDRCLGCWGAIV